MIQFVGWLAGKGFDYAAERMGLIRSGQRTAENLNTIIYAGGLSATERAQLTAMRNNIDRAVAVLEQTNRSSEQMRRDIRSLRLEMYRSFEHMQGEMDRLEQRITSVELAQGRQLKMIVDLRGDVVRLQDAVLAHDGRLIALEQRVAVHDERIRDIEDKVYPDPNRFYRHEWILSGSALYANSPTLGNDAKIGGVLTAQYNLSKHFGLFSDLMWAPISASDAEGFPSDSHVYWESYGATLGVSLNLLPPQSYVSLQVGAGGGIIHSSLSEYPNGASITDTEAAIELGSVSNAAVIGKAELGISPPAASVEPFAAFGYLRTVDDLIYDGSETTTNAGNALWYLTLGLRWRSYNRSRSR